MSEETRPDDDSPMVCVRAVVMTRDDSSGGWVPLGGGGLSKVGVYRQRGPDDPAATAATATPAATTATTTTTTFRIHGERPRDNLVMLECLLDQDLVYNKVTPTFHHWRIHQKKFGLTFQSPADARAFDRGVRKALEDLNLGAPTPPGTVSSERDGGSEDEGCNAADSGTSCSSHLCATERREQMRRQASLATEASRGHYHVSPHEAYTRHYPSDCLHQAAPPPRRFSRHVSFLDEAEAARVEPRREVWFKGYEDYRYALALRRQLEHHHDAAAAGATDSYVHFDDKAESGSKKHDYSYPYLEGGPYSTAKDGLSVVVTQPSPGSKKRGGGGGKPPPEDVERQRCVYCREMFAAHDNGRGRCPDAPDPVRGCIHRASCLWCAESVLYHCMSDPEGDYTDPCSCDPTDDSFCLRWLALSGLSLLAPCMCCYPPLMLCHRCGERCGCCGGKHKAIS
ncbi:sprouty-related, EVH1 domain-containing protein 2-like [Lethenteron reissneri]|uniref:sprouty-related, EVH1 domain-containing protein 2-like n=1 Tax=Lethenteron reissneri TaxID=7753 RepID=UPI002AB7996B|nr:sprouty-related, EVH1 domain-containing protein 2-like [Lethenteron reissneri]